MATWAVLADVATAALPRVLLGGGRTWPEHRGAAMVAEALPERPDVAAWAVLADVATAALPASC